MLNHIGYIYSLLSDGYYISNYYSKEVINIKLLTENFHDFFLPAQLQDCLCKNSIYKY